MSVIVKNKLENSIKVLLATINLAVQLQGYKTIEI
jgi:hypothetical protein